MGKIQSDTLEYSIGQYVQEFTRIYMVTKPDFIAKTDVEYIVITGG